MSQQAEEDVTQFILEQHSFQELMMEVTRYQQLADEIQYATVKVHGPLHQLLFLKWLWLKWIRHVYFPVFQVVRLGMFEVHSHELVRALVKRAEGLMERMVTHMLQDHQQLNKK